MRTLEASRCSLTSRCWSPTGYQHRPLFPPAASPFRNKIHAATTKGVRITDLIRPPRLFINHPDLFQHGAELGAPLPLLPARGAPPVRGALLGGGFRG